jgi:hypothetical protein
MIGSAFHAVTQVDVAVTLHVEARQPAENPMPIKP